MEIKTFQNTYDLAEFHCYITKNTNNECINVIELLLDIPNTEDLSYLEQDFSNIFIVEAHNHNYVFSNYEVSEYFIDESGMVKVICVK